MTFWTAAELIELLQGRYEPDAPVYLQVGDEMRGVDTVTGPVQLGEGLGAEVILTACPRAIRPPR